MSDNALPSIDFEYEYVEEQPKVSEQEPDAIESTLQAYFQKEEQEIDEALVKRNLFKHARSGNLKEFVKVADLIPSRT